MTGAHDERPIGIFDSGIGGLTVTAAIRQALPTERLLYFGDNAHVPYGQRSLDEVRGFSHAIVEALIGADCKLIVIACNTASAAALASLRAAHPGLPFVGMEPAVKPAVEHTSTGTVGVIATTATFQSELYASIVERFAGDVEVLHQPCPGLVKQIEAGETGSPTTEAMLRGWLQPMLDRHIDALVLGCTHYPLVRPLIERIVGPGVRIIDPSPAIARRVDHLLREHALRTSATAGGLQCWTSGDPAHFAPTLEQLGLGGTEVRQARWSTAGTLILP
ncbi:MAG TPA: glutamate racemase [Flavobacteriales bacterium]|nr:glutamate racemase [Flavobacteriales bacterium]